MAGFDLRGGKPANYVLGRGKVYLSGDTSKSQALDTNNTIANSTKVWRDVGNVTGFTVSQESETKEHKSSLQGLQVIDLEVPVSQKMSISFTVDEINPSNLARFMSGYYLGLDNDTGSAGLLNGAAVVSTFPTSASDDNFFIDTDTTDRVHDVWYDITLRVDGTNEAPCMDFEAQATQAITVSKIAADRNTTGTVLTENDDYEIDRQMGRIRFFSTGGLALTAGDNFLVEWAAPSVDKGPGTPNGEDYSLFSIKPLETSGVTVGLKFIQENANDGDIPIAVEFWQVKLKPDGEYAGIGDDWATLTFTGVVQSDTVTGGTYGSDYGRILGRNSFST